jgi:hypothetical protein
MPMRSARLAAKTFGFKLEVAVARCAADTRGARTLMGLRPRHDCDWMWGVGWASKAL